MDDHDAERKRIHQLLLSGDNTLKNRDDEGRRDRARARFEEARRVAEAAGLTDALTIIDRRLELLGGADAA
jgi:thiamine monophosphate synthase